jgi:hypothetical protein
VATERQAERQPDPAPTAPPAARTHAIVVEAAASTAAWTRIFRLENFRYARSGWWIDALMPHEPRAFLAFAFLAPIALWAIGYAFAPDEAAYLAAPDIRSQMPFLSAHLVALRMLAGLVARGTAPALGGLGVTSDDTQRFRRGIIGWVPNLAGPVVAGFWLVRDTTVALIPGPNGLTAFDDPEQWDLGALGEPHQHALLGIWLFEWIIFGIILWVQVWNMFALARTIRRTDFEPHLDRIMVHDEYRDFFALIARNATICAGFALANLAFIAYTGELVPKPTRAVTNLSEFFEEMSDLTSVGVLFIVIVAGYVGYVFLIRRALTRAIDHAFAPTGDRILEESCAPGAASGEARPQDLEHVNRRLDDALVLLKAIAFQREVDALGGRGLTILMAKALPVLGTIGLRVYQLITHQGPPG